MNQIKQIKKQDVKDYKGIGRLSKKEVMNYLKNYYPKLGTIETIRNINKNNIRGSKFLVKIKNKKYIFTNYYEDIKPKDMNEIYSIVSYCKENNIRVHEIILNKNKKFVDTKRKCYLLKYYPGNIFHDSKKEIRDIAKNIALMHKALKQITKKNVRKNSTEYKILTLKELKSIEINLQKKKLNSHEIIIKNDFNYIKKSIVAHKKNSLLIKKSKMSKQIIHNDLHPKNIIMKKEIVNCIIDFNSMRTGIVIEDIALSSFRFACFYPKSIKQIYQQINYFLKNYNNVNKIKLDMKIYEFFIFDYLLSRLSFILRNEFFNNSSLWFHDYSQFKKFIMIAEKLMITSRYQNLKT
jgi:Ser/Thr protein kinase RdoA (MazF antagonist)